MMKKTLGRILYPRERFEKILRALDVGGCVLDVGCQGFRLFRKAQEVGRPDLVHCGLDYMDVSASCPENFHFALCDLNEEVVPFEDNKFDLIIACHVIEHLDDPIAFIMEMRRLLKPGGCLFLEAPSERSVNLPGAFFNLHEGWSLSFYDDPTHKSRPWTPQAFWRLCSYAKFEVVETRHYISWPVRIMLPVLLLGSYLAGSAKRFESFAWLAVGWACYVVALKPLDDAQSVEFKYDVSGFSNQSSGGDHQNATGN